MEFLSQTDIGNRALQHCGQPMMSATSGFTENSIAARHVSFAYPKLRRAELRRNTWRFATRRVALRPVTTTTMLLVPAMWVAGTTYFVGSIVADENNNIWTSRIPDNLGNDPQNTSVWEPYFGPLSVSLYDSATAYLAGEVVYTSVGTGLYKTFASLQGENEDNPATTPTWDAATTYSKNHVVTYLGTSYMSRIDLNVGQQPNLTPAAFVISTTYAAADTVVGSDLQIYTSVQNGNVGHDPVLDDGTWWTTAGLPAPWTTSFVAGTVTNKWVQIGGAEFPSGVALATMAIIYPVGTGPTSQSSRNVYRLPNGYLRTAPQAPKAGAVSYLGAPGGLTYNDWEFENDFLVTARSDVLSFRFVADVTDVSRMDDMFCEGLAASIAKEICEPLTQSTAKLASIRQAYKDCMSQARTVNAIEIGADEPPEDDWITTRA